MMSSPQRSSARNVQSGVSATILFIITRWGLPKLQSKDVHRLWPLKWKRYFVFRLSLSILIVGTFRVSKSSMHWIHWRDGVLYLGWIWRNGLQVFYSTCFEEEELVKKAGIIALVTWILWIRSPEVLLMHRRKNALQNEMKYSEMLGSWSLQALKPHNWCFSTNRLPMNVLLIENTDGRRLG